MPIYEYRCIACDERFEELVRNPDVTVACPACGDTSAERLLSVFAGVGGGSKGAAAPDWSRVAAKRAAASCGPGCGCHH
jgi:putative FmdB family regulatory protein